MLKVKKKENRVISTNCVFISIDVVLVSFFVNFGHISHCSFIHKEQQSIVNLLYCAISKITYCLMWALDECVEVIFTSATRH